MTVDLTKVKLIPRIFFSHDIQNILDVMEEEMKHAYHKIAVIPSYLATI